MGWTSSSDTQAQVGAGAALHFNTPEEAARFCRRQGWAYTVLQPDRPKSGRHRRWVGPRGWPGRSAAAAGDVCSARSAGPAAGRRAAGSLTHPSIARPRAGSRAMETTSASNGPGCQTWATSTTCRPGQAGRLLLGREPLRGPLARRAAGLLRRAARRGAAESCGLVERAASAAQR